MKKTFATFLLLIASVVACGSESDAEQKAPPPGVDLPVPPTNDPSNSNKISPQLETDVVGPDLDAGTGEQDGGSTEDGGTTDPVDPTDGGTTNPTDPTDGGTIDPTDPTDGGTGGETDSGTGGEQDGGTTTPPPPPTSATVGCVQVDLVSAEGATFCYQVTELASCKDLSHWDLGTNCTVLSGTEPIYAEDGVTILNGISSFEIGTDPKSGVKGAKWNVTDSFSSDQFCVTVDGQPTLATGEVQVASKSGLPISTGAIAGPVCQ
jgi:hypothetical protein